MERKREVSGGEEEREKVGQNDGENELETFLDSCRAVSLPCALGDLAPQMAGGGDFKEIR